jgi:TolB protein
MIANPNVKMSLSRSGLFLVVCGVGWLTLAPARAPGAETGLKAASAIYAPAREQESATEPTLEDDLADVGRPLWLIDADGSNLRRLTRMTDYTCCGTPQWCADGTKIACDAWKGHKGEDYGDAHVLVISVDGSSVEDLGDGAMPSWSPGGNRIAYCRYGSGVWIMCADGSAKAQLDRSGWCARWSPDGRKIAWVVYDEGCNLCVHDLIEGDRRLVLEGEHRGYAGINHSFTWSPDGKRLCFKGHLGNDKSEIVIVDAEGSSKGFKVRFAEKTGWNLSWRPDGRRIMLGLRNPETKSMQLYTMNPDAEDQPELFPGQPATRINAESAWSPDGKTIVFPSERRK